MFVTPTVIYIGKSNFSGVHIVRVGVKFCQGGKRFFPGRIIADCYIYCDFVDRLAETTGLTSGELDRRFTTLLAEKKARRGGSCLAEWKRIWKNKKNKQ